MSWLKALAPLDKMSFRYLRGVPVTDVLVEGGSRNIFDMLYAEERSQLFKSWLNDGILEHTAHVVELTRVPIADGLVAFQLPMGLSKEVAP